VTFRCGGGHGGGVAAERAARASVHAATRSIRHRTAAPRSTGEPHISPEPTQINGCWVNHEQPTASFPD
jgi:hypothetical protein